MALSHPLTLESFERSFSDSDILWDIEVTICNILELPASECADGSLLVTADRLFSGAGRSGLTP